jgi:hypothetical protein
VNDTDKDISNQHKHYHSRVILTENNFRAMGTPKILGLKSTNRTWFKESNFPVPSTREKQTVAEQDSKSQGREGRWEADGQLHS